MSLVAEKLSVAEAAGVAVALAEAGAEAMETEAVTAANRYTSKSIRKQMR